MKRIKKIFSMALALTMLLALSVTASAAGTGGETVGTTISTKVTGHTYEVYQIFTGDYHKAADGTKHLSNLKWGKNGKPEEETVQVGAPVSEQVLADLETVKDSTDKQKLGVIQKYANLTNEDNAYGEVTSVKPLTGVPAGYYLIKDLDNSQSGAADKTNTAYTLYVVQVVGEPELEITAKSDIPKVEKKVQDVNDSEANSTTEWQDSADYDIGDEVPFQLTATIGDRYNDYNAYKLVFHDTLSQGLTFKQNSVVVKVNGAEINENLYTVNTDIKDTCSFEVVFDDLKQITQVTSGSKITVEYNATLNENAVIGAAGNPNTVYLEYSNNPNDATGNEIGRTPEDTVIVFTYEFEVNKKDENGSSLAGAAFKLEKKVKSGETEKWELVKEFTVDGNNSATTFTFKGLDDGTYRLTETKTPAGYNTIEPIVFTISADHVVEATDPTLTDLTVAVENKAAQITATAARGKLTTNVVNKKGATLPETGGIGTTVFYVVGAILVLGSAVLLITRKRMR